MSQNPYAQEASSPKSKDGSPSDSDWLANLIIVSRLIVNTGDVIAVPHVRWAVSAVLFFLESCEIVNHNRNTYRELAEYIVDFMKIISNKACLGYEGEMRLNHMAVCFDFQMRVVQISQGLKLLDQSNRIQRFWKKDLESYTITRSKKALNDVKLDALIKLGINGESYLCNIYRTMLLSRGPYNNISYEPTFKDFRIISAGEAELLRCYLASRCTPNANIVDTKAKVGRVVKDVRVYRGPKALELWKEEFRLHSYIRHPYVLQLFGVSDSAQHPALFFHEELFSILDFEMECVRTPLESVLFNYKLMKDYQAGHKYLTSHFLDCLYDQFVWGSDFYYAGCSCGPFHSHTYRCETLVTDRGRTCISFSTDIPTDLRIMRSGVNINVPTPPSHLLDMVQKIANSPTTVMIDRDDLKACLAAFHAHVLKLGLLTPQFSARLEVPSGDICDTQRDYSGPEICAPMFISDNKCFVAGRVTFSPVIPTVDEDYSNWKSCSSGRGPEYCSKVGNWTRFTIISAPGLEYDEFEYSAICEVTDLNNYGESWISQAAYTQSQLSPFMIGPHPGIILTTHAECVIIASSNFTPPTQSSELEEVYLFVEDFLLNEEGIAKKPRVFWSFNPLGGRIIQDEFVISDLSKAQMDAINLLPPAVMMRSWGVTWNESHYEAVREFHSLCGFDPDTRQVAEFLGLPLVEVHPVRPRLKRRRSTPCRIQTYYDPEFNYYTHFYDGQPVYDPNPIPLIRERRKSFSEYLDAHRPHGEEPNPVYPYEHSL